MSNKKPPKSTKSSSSPQPKRARTGAATERAATSASTRRGAPARSNSTAARPRIRATHSEGSGPGAPDRDGERSNKDLERRRAKAKATLATFGDRAAPRKALPPPSKREGATARRRSVPPASAPSAESRELALAIAAAGLEKKALGVEVIDVSGRVDYAEFLVIMTGTSDRHVHAIAMGIEEALKKKKLLPLSVEGLGAATWVLMDFDDVVVHVFQEDTRRIYDIEGLWMDASRISVGPSSNRGLTKPPDPNH